MQEVNPSLCQDWHSLSNFGKNLLSSYIIVYFPDDNIISIKVSVQVNQRYFLKEKEVLCLIITYSIYNQIIMKSLYTCKYTHLFQKKTLQTFMSAISFICEIL